MNDFVRDDTWQRTMRDKILARGFYKNYAACGRYVFIDKGVLASQIQREFAVDTIVQGKDGSAICIEEKIVRWPKKDEPYSAFVLETKSCTVPGREKTGWMSYGMADYLFYCFANKSEDELTCYLIDFPRLQAWFWPCHQKYNVSISKQINRTECRVVPIADVKQAVPTYRQVVLQPF